MTHDYEDASHLQPIWEICHILYFSKDNDIATELGTWLNEHEAIPSLEEQRANDPDEEYEEHNMIGPTWIWEDARRQLLRGNFGEVIDVLNFSLSFVNPNDAFAIHKIISLIQEFQEIREQQDEAAVYKEKWTTWHEKCVECATEYENSSKSTEYADEKSDEILLLFSVLGGKERLLFGCGTFIENIVGTILFSRPQITTAGVNQLAQHMDYKDVETDTALKACELFLLGCFDDAFDVCDNDVWLQTHLGYALMVVGAMNNDFRRLTKSANNEQVLDPIYYCIQQYASDIAEKFDMWDEAVIYLSCCSINSEIWIKYVKFGLSSI